jgi:hypothetical protein
MLLIPPLLYCTSNPLLYYTHISNYHIHTYIYTYIHTYIRAAAVSALRSSSKKDPRGQKGLILDPELTAQDLVAGISACMRVRCILMV